MWNDIKKSTTFNVGDTVRKNNTDDIGKIKTKSVDSNRFLVYFAGQEKSVWVYKYEITRISNGTNIRSIKSLYKKAMFNPSSNHAEEKAIRFFDILVEECKQILVLTSEATVKDEKYCDKRVDELFNEYEKRALQYYRKIRL